jgi:hypothetical protein
VGREADAVPDGRCWRRPSVADRAGGTTTITMRFPIPVALNRPMAP